MTEKNGWLQLGKYSIGMGDRFGHQAGAQLRACMSALDDGVEVTPVWNKSNREHVTIGSEPSSTRAAADAAVKALGWRGPYYVDADHINLGTVARFLACSDFFTIDVADWIGRPASEETIHRFADKHKELAGRISVPGIEEPFELRRPIIERIAAGYLLAIQEAAKIYRHIAQRNGAGRFITEISMDETEKAQSPAELLVILAAIADEGIPVQTIAPKFTGRFNKGVDYVGNVRQFETEFNDNLAVIRFAVQRYALPANLKLSVHSGSDKFSIYPAIRRGLGKFDAGLHIKTAGTTWLEEVIGLAQSGGTGLAIAQEIYGEAMEHIEELTAPYANVIDIDREKLPSAAAVNSWTSTEFAAALRHEPKKRSYNRHLRQLIHIGYKVAAKMGDRYLGALDVNHAVISENVTQNLYERHLKPIFAGLEVEGRRVNREGPRRIRRRAAAAAMAGVGK